MEKRLYRDELNKKVAGVCAGLADYLSIDVTIIRVIFLITLIAKGGGGLIYLILWAALPKKPLNLYNNPHVDYTVPPQSAPFTFTSGGVPPNVPFSAQPVKKSSNAGLVAGIVLVLMGSFFLLDQFNIIPDISFDKFWPMILIVVGVGILFSGKKDQPTFTDNAWDAKKEDVKFEENASNTTSTTGKTE